MLPTPVLRSPKPQQDKPKGWKRGCPSIITCISVIRSLSGRDPARRSYRSYATFSDPDGNGWLLQEVTERLPGRVDTEVTDFASVGDLAGALRRAAAAHGDHEKRNGGEHDHNWPDWYAAYMVAEHAGKPLPE